MRLRPRCQTSDHQCLASSKRGAIRVCEDDLFPPAYLGVGGRGPVGGGPGQGGYWYVVAEGIVLGEKSSSETSFWVGARSTTER